jgi:phosphoribosylanthranilate isomerase
MRVQIYTMQSPAEAQAVAALGVNHEGITPSERGLPGEVNLETAAQIAAAVLGQAVSIALSVETDAAAIVAMVEAVRPVGLLLCGVEGAVPPVGVEALREQLPGLPLMQAVSVAGPEAIEQALAYQAVADYLILDTQAADIAGIGASGQAHDWTISREIVRRVRVPVILAGGLSPENVAEAIRVVQPWGVDSLTHTNEFLPDGGFRKDLARIRQFVAQARAV